MQNKKSQIAIFILLGIVLLIAVSFIVYTKNETKKIEEELIDLPLEIQPIKLFVDSCIKQTSEEGIDFISLQGGYYDVPEPNVNEFIFEVPYYFYSGQNNFPQKDAIQEELGRYIEDNLNSCLNNFLVLKDQGYEIEQGSIEADTKFIQNRVLVNLEYPLTIKKQDTEFKLEKFISTIDFDFNHIYEILIDIQNEQQKHMNAMPLGALSDLAYYYNFSFEIYNNKGEDKIYSLIFNETHFLKNPYIFSFAVKYDLDWSEENPVKIFEIPDQIGYAGYEFTYQVEAEGNELRYHDYSLLFDINESTGEIKFIPTNEHGGKHFVMIKAEDSEGNNDTKMFELEVKEYNRKPYIESIPDFTIGVNQLFYYKVNASDPDGDIIFYSDNSDLFDIDMLTGEIQFTTTEDMKGTHLINITAVDIGITVVGIKGLVDIEEFKLEVE